MRAILLDTRGSLANAVFVALFGGARSIIQVPLVCPLRSYSGSHPTLENLLEVLACYTCRITLALEGLHPPNDKYSTVQCFFEIGRRKASEHVIRASDDDGPPEDHIYAYKQCSSDRPAFTLRERAPVLPGAAADDKHGSTEVSRPQLLQMLLLCGTSTGRLGPFLFSEQLLSIVIQYATAL